MKVADHYIVAINPRFSYGSQKKTLIHEVIHIIQNHFQCNSNDIDSCEREVENLIYEIKILFQKDDDNTNLEREWKLIFSKKSHKEQIT